jgi:predicted RNA-binding Zn ribbon-like protein
MASVLIVESGDALDALMELLRTAPVEGLPEGLHHPSQLRAIAEAAGLAVEPAFDLEAYADQVRRRLGWDPEVAGTEGLRSDRDDGRHQCPAPTLEHVLPAARLRDRLAAALNTEDNAKCAAALTSISVDQGLFVGLSEHCQPRIMARTAGFLPQFAAPLTAAAMGIAARGLLPHLKRCADPLCGLPFFDRSRDGRGCYCSSTCSSRAKARRRRERNQPIG